MIIKIIRDNNERLHECTGVSISPPDKEGDALITLEPDGPNFYIGEHSGTAMYCLSDTGQTVDSYRWPKKKGRKKDGK